ncbi:hypothetical protein ANO14919_132280 [Xylariales sp. No.14919]|nr:hypothetical protein ANO14919_132280 [Xylariales sp. No.14919]
MDIFNYAESGDLEGLNRCIKSGVSLNQRDNVLGRTPILIATLHDHLEIIDSLIQSHADINISDHEGKSPLYLAAEYGRVKIVERLLLAKADANQKAHNDSTPLHAAAYGESEEIPEAPIKRSGGNEEAVDPVNSDGSIAPHLAASTDRANAIEALLKDGSNINALNREGESPLMLAARRGCIDSTKALLGNKAIDFSIQDARFGRTALSWAASEGKTDVFELLAKHDSDINSMDYDGRTPLILAVRSGGLELVKTLITYGPNLEIRDGIYEQSAISYAAEEGWTEIVALLIDAGCDIYSQGTESFPPLERAVFAGNVQILQSFLEQRSAKSPPEKSPPEKLPRVKAIEEALYHAHAASFWYRANTVINWILEKKQYLTATDESGRTALSLAASNGHKDVVKALLGIEFVDPDWHDNNKRTALSLAAEGGYHDIVSLLLGRDVKVNSEDAEKRTPLSWAAASASKETVRLLLDHGADLDSRDSNNRTPLSWAAGSGSEVVVRQLLPIVSEKPHPAGSSQTGRQAASVDSKDDKYHTPLWYAALGGHLKVTLMLLEHGANPFAKDSRGNNLIDHLTTESPRSDGTLTSLSATRKLLEPYFSLMTKPLSYSDKVDGAFSALSVWFPNNIEKGLKYKPIPVNNLLSQKYAPRDGSPSQDFCLKWLHLPANNVSFIPRVHNILANSE